MKFRFENLGLIDKADLDIKNLTIICGENNTGKTYATYAVYGFLRVWRRLLQSAIQDDVESFIRDDGSYRIDLEQMCKGKINSYLQVMGEKYLEALPIAFSTSGEFFENAKVIPSVDEDFDIRGKKYHRSIKAGTSGKLLATLSKEIGSLHLEVLVSDDGFFKSLHNGLQDFIAEAVGDIVFSPYLPSAHISSAERTGATIFRKELDFSRTRMIEAIGKMKTNELKNPLSLIRQMEAGYPWPVQDNVDFVRQLEDLAKNVGGLGEQAPEVLKAFDSIIGGSYKVIKNQGLVYQPKGVGKPRFSMSEASSSIRALLDVGFYLRCKARPGDLFIIDEPELNLHPKSQRAFARLVARLINCGIKVFITTHSDYIIKEINTLIMLNQRTEHTVNVQRQHGYEDAELIDSDRVALYMTSNELAPAIEPGKRSSRINTLKLARIYRDRGIEVETFDTTIEEMNAVQDEILYGGSI